MVVTGTFHPPAGINPLLVVSNNLPFILVRAGAGGCRAAGRVCLCLAPLDPPPAVAATLVLTRLE
jgi:hypothetical protein